MTLNPQESLECIREKPSHYESYSKTRDSILYMMTRGNVDAFVSMIQTFVDSGNWIQLYHVYICFLNECWLLYSLPECPVDTINQFIDFSRSVRT